MTHQHIIDILHAWAPPSLAEGYDNVGLLAGLPEDANTGTLVALELTAAVLDEAIDKQCNLIVCHHPIWFGKRTRLDGSDWVSRLILRAIREGVALHAIHTNLDNIQTGVNREICQRLDLQNTCILRPKQPETPEIGSGMLGKLSHAERVETFLQRLKAVFGSGCIKYTPFRGSQVQRIAICGGSGSFLLEDALQAGADAFVTGDVTHHKFFDAEDKILYCDIGHWESEQFTSDLIYDYLSLKSENFRNFALYKSAVKTNPVRYFS